MKLTVQYGDKAVQIIIPDDFDLKGRHAAFDIARDALLRDEVTAQLRVDLAAQGFDYDELLAEGAK